LAGWIAMENNTHVRVSHVWLRVRVVVWVSRQPGASALRGNSSISTRLGKRTVVITKSAGGMA
jgi:hypothetical protein